MERDAIRTPWRSACLTGVGLGRDSGGLGGSNERDTCRKRAKRAAIAGGVTVAECPAERARPGVRVGFLGLGGGRQHQGRAKAQRRAAAQL